MWSFLSLAIMLSRFFHVPAAWIISFCSQILSYPLGKLPFSSSFHPLIYTWVVCTISVIRMLLWTLVYRHLELLFSVLWGPYPAMEVLGHMVILCLTFWRILTGFWSLPPGFAGGFSLCPIWGLAYSACASTAILNSGNIPMTTCGPGTSHVMHTCPPSSGSLAEISGGCTWRGSTWTSLWVCWAHLSSYIPSPSKDLGSPSWGETSYLLPYFEAIVNSDSMPRSTRSFCHSRFQENWLDHGQGLLGSPEP